MAGIKADNAAEAEAALHPPVHYTFDDMQVTLDFDSQEWVLVPRIVMASTERKKRRWAKDVAVPIGERYGYGKRHAWTTTLTAMLLLFTEVYYLSKVAVLLRVSHEPDVAPYVRPTTLDVVDEIMGTDELAQLLSNPGVPERRPALIEYPQLQAGVVAACVTRYFWHDDGEGPYVSIMLGYPASDERLAMFETVVSRDDDAEADTARDDTVRIAGSTRLVSG